MYIDLKTLAFMKGRFDRSKEYQIKEGMSFVLSFYEYVELHTRKHIDKIEGCMKRLAKHTHGRKPQPDVCLTWIDYKSKSSGIMSIDTAIVTSKKDSDKRNRIGAGDKMRATHRANISKPKGPQAEEHKEAISEAKKGVSISKWSPERHAKNAERLAARKAKNAI